MSDFRKEIDKVVKEALAKTFAEEMKGKKKRPRKVQSITGQRA